jgi:hypothetical protein
MERGMHTLGRRACNTCLIALKKTMYFLIPTVLHLWYQKIYNDDEEGDGMHSHKSHSPFANLYWLFVCTLYFCCYFVIALCCVQVCLYANDVLNHVIMWNMSLVACWTLVMWLCASYVIYAVLNYGAWLNWLIDYPHACKRDIWCLIFFHDFTKTAKRA